MLKLLVPPGVPKDVLTQKSTQKNRQAPESQPSVPVNLTYN